MLAIPEKWKEKLLPWIAEHPIHVINLAKQEESVRVKYKSDFRHVADYFACLGDADKMKKFVHEENRVICHPEEYLEMMAAFSSEKRFLALKENIDKTTEVGEEGVKMEGFFDALERMAREDGISQGKQEIIRKMLVKGKSPEQIKELIEEPLEYIYHVQEQMPQTVGTPQTVEQDIEYDTSED